MLNLGSEQKKNQERKNKKIELASKYLGDFFVAGRKKVRQPQPIKNTTTVLDFLFRDFFEGKKVNNQLDKKKQKSKVKSQNYLLLT